MTEGSLASLVGRPLAAQSVYNRPMNPELQKKGYVFAERLLEPTLASVIYKTILLQHWRGEAFRDNHMPTATSVSNTAMTDALLLEMQPTIEAIAGCALVPTYSYARVYFHGDTMIRHKDRGSCEVSVSINLAREGGKGSLWFQPGVEVHMGAGDGAVYLGCTTDHWRDPFTGHTLGQIFLHYVVAGGEQAAHYFDGHPQRFPPSVSAGLTRP